MLEGLLSSLQTQLAAHNSCTSVIHIVSTYLTPNTFMCDQKFAAFEIWCYFKEAYSVLENTGEYVSVLNVNWHDCLY
jgi:hypothetical protein